MINIKINKGYSLIELLVVITIFALLGVLVTQSLVLSIRGSKKSEASDIVRTNLKAASTVFERQLRNANSVTSCDDAKVVYEDEFGGETSFECKGDAADGFVFASGSAILINNDVVKLTYCRFVPELNKEGHPDRIGLMLTGTDINNQGAESADISFSTRVLLRNY